MNQEIRNLKPESITDTNLWWLVCEGIRVLIKFWWVVLGIIISLAILFFVVSKSNYIPMYEAKATFTVETYTNQNGYTFYYDNSTASQMAKTFPFLLDSNLLLDRVKTDLGSEIINGVLGADVVTNSNLFTLYVKSNSPKDAYNILLALIDNYPEVSEYVIGKTQLNMIDTPKVPDKPYNGAQHLKSMAAGAVLGLFLSLIFIMVMVISRNTVRKKDDIENKLHTQCLGTIPLVVAKRRSKNKNPDLSIRNPKLSTAFKESVRGITLHTEKITEDRKVICVTSSVLGEGVTTVAKNLAYALGDSGKKVLLLDGNFQEDNPIGTGFEKYLAEKCELASVIKQLADKPVWKIACTKGLSVKEIIRYYERLREVIDIFKEKVDYIIIDAPPCQNLDKLNLAAEFSDALIYVIAQDKEKLYRIMNNFEDLAQLDAKLIGCVLNSVKTTLTSYGYGYGYGGEYHYGRYGKYGKYGSYGYGYGYGESKRGKKEDSRTV